MNLPFVSLVLFVAALAEGAKVYDVMNSAAVGDGSHDDSQAFIKAWQLTCGDSGTQGTPTFYVPGGKKFLLKPVVFKGPCKSNSVRVQIDGTLTAPTSKGGWVNCISRSWLSFEYVKNLIVTGSGTINGQGQLWWDGTPMQGDPSCANRPNALFFAKCDGLVLSGLHHVNSPRIHIQIYGCQDASLSNFYIVAPGNSPNTDGIDISASTNINIHDASIQTGDDCIAINSNTFYVNITRVACGPGHGISIGSLGEHGEHATVQHVHVRNCSLTGTMFGARIKTCQGGAGNVNNVVFEDIILNNAGHPIIIDQFYKSTLIDSWSRELKSQAPLQAPTQAPLEPPTQAPLEVPTQAPLQAPANSNLKIDGVTYSGFEGTSSTIEAITLKCDQLGCTNIIMSNINIIASSSINGKSLTSFCSYASGKAQSTVPEVKCLSH